jgi:hypothetical protein
MNENGHGESANTFSFLFKDDNEENADTYMRMFMERMQALTRECLWRKCRHLLENVYGETADIYFENVYGVNADTSLRIFMG